jgi:hypothetical protein
MHALSYRSAVACRTYVIDGHCKSIWNGAIQGRDEWEWAFCRESNSTRSLRHRKYSAHSSRSLAAESHSSVHRFVLAFAPCLLQYSPSSHLSSSLILLFLIIDLISSPFGSGDIYIQLYMEKNYVISSYSILCIPNFAAEYN